MLAMPSSRYIAGSLPWYSVLIVTGIVLALWHCSREEKRLELPRDTFVDLALWAIPFGVIGARLYYVIFSWETFAGNPVSILKIWEGGLAIYGGVIGGVIGVMLFAGRRKLSPAILTDMIVPGLTLAQAVGRWGNYFNMEAYGGVITDPRWQFFPAGVLIPENGAPVWHMATFFYESMWNLLVFALLMAVRKRLGRRGDLTCLYLICYGLGRLVIEGLRVDSLMWGPVRVSQALSLALILGAMTVMIFQSVRARSKTKREA